MHRGYIKIWRKSVDNGWLHNHLLWTFWCWCLMKATHKAIDVMVGYQKVHLEPGQLVFGRNNAAHELRASPQRIRTCIVSLKILKNIAIKSTNKYSIITILNWDTYQDDQPTTNQQHNKQLTSNQPATNHKQTHKHINTKRIKDFTPAGEHDQEYVESLKDTIAKNPIPSDFQLTPGLKSFAIKKGIPEEQIENWFDAFVNKYRATGDERKDWASAWFAYISAVATNPKNRKQREEDVDAWIKRVSQS